ncbi:MAG: hypothetical protein MUP66_03930 [Candidatus Nanohaloarchaeota archaeon QJJ-5]|nr:hypothetical protein [Candidatus Nanohaloarchaeota archaeon QJJ-5]
MDIQIGMPDPAQGTCPDCGDEQTFVPVLQLTKGGARVAYKCTNCSHQIEHEQ